MAVRRRLRVRAVTPRVFSSSFKNAEMNGASIISNARRSGDVRNRFCANRSRSLNVSRYELIVPATFEAYAGVSGFNRSHHCLHASPRQDDFAKRPILRQMAQGLARLAEGIDPLDDRLD